MSGLNAIDWSITNCTNAMSTDKAPTLESIKAAMDKFEAMKPRNLPDVFVMTRDFEARLRKKLATDDITGQPEEVGIFGSLYGIPFESFACAFEAIRRVDELRREGKNAELCI